MAKKYFKTIKHRYNRERRTCENQIKPRKQFKHNIFEQEEKIRKPEQRRMPRQEHERAAIAFLVRCQVQILLHDLEDQPWRRKTRRKNRSVDFLFRNGGSEGGFLNSLLQTCNGAK